jgi:anti-sigma regulatory factor (Ser/Thr protein kinase)
MVCRDDRAPASTQDLTFSVTSGRELGPMRAALRDWLGPRADATAVDEILLATGEAMANALEHGRPPVTMNLTWADGGQLAITIHDGGSWGTAPDGGARGRGLPIMSTLMDAVTVDTADGTRVVLTRHFD